MSNHDRHGSPSSNRDAALESAWREASDEQPPSHLDAAIIAAARQSVPNRGEHSNTAPVRAQSRNWVTTWQPLAAAATVAGLAFVLVQMLPREHDSAPSIQYKESAPVPAATMPQPQTQSQTSSAHETTGNSQLPSAGETVARPERVAVPDRAPAQSAVPAPPVTLTQPATTVEATARETAASADTAAAFGETSADRQKTAKTELAGRAATAAAAAPSAPARERDAGKAAPLDAAAWADKIAALHASGDVTAAAGELRAFRAADPVADTYLPDSLREWARTVE